MPRPFAAPAPSRGERGARPSGAALEEVRYDLYIMLADWTDQGVRHVQDAPKRLDAAKKALGAMGGEFKAFYMTMGDHDMVAVYEAPDDAIAARFSLQVGMLGNIRTRTLKAFPEAAFREIISTLG